MDKPLSPIKSLNGLTHTYPPPYIPKNGCVRMLQSVKKHRENGLTSLRWRGLLWASSSSIREPKHARRKDSTTTEAMGSALLVETRVHAHVYVATVWRVWSTSSRSYRLPCLKTVDFNPFEDRAPVMGRRHSKTEDKECPRRSSSFR